MRSFLAGLRTLVLPWGASSSSPRIVINVNPVPAELTTYYQSAPEGTNPETVVGVTINYDGAGNYAYQALVIDSSTPKITSLVTGASVGGTVNEAQRFALNPGVVLGNARFQTFLEQNILIGTSPTGTDTMFATQALTDGFHRWSVSRDGVVGFGPGNVITDAFIDRIAAGILRAANRLDLVSFGVVGDTVLGCYLNGDNNPRRTIRASGEMRAGDGINTTDTTHYRAAAGVWASDDIAWNNAGAKETWHAMTLQNGWTNFGGADVTAQYKRVAAPDHAVWIVGIIAPGTKTDGTLIATLPAGYQPTHTVEVPLTYDGTATAGSPRFAVNSSGQITINGVSGVTTLQAVGFSQFIPLDA